MKYRCSEGHIFIHPAKVTNYNYQIPQMTPEEKAQLTGLGFKDAVQKTFLAGTLETSVCPLCDKGNGNRVFDEVADADVEKVYVYELTTGEQTELDKLLAEGYVIVNRYSKQYHLEKPKEVKAP